MRLIQLSRESLNFPPPEMALREPNGLLAIGGDLSPSRLLAAYQRGIFPWFSAGDPILWWSPDPRAVLLPETFHLSRSMKRFHQRSPYRVTLNQAFKTVIDGCASERDEGTWITPEVKHAWLRLFEMGKAQSIEVWQDDEVVGGMYGLALGQVFCGESMFSRRENASKTALLVFSRYFHQNGGRLIDCQILNPHTASLGAQEVSRAVYLNSLQMLGQQSVAEDCWQVKTLF
ncbi:leucyl/phenylalanyl-tRNA--protein transferase [[Pantoea] beijingensis]|uniref:Leucyl/phenylalanyl-tRNA--protein transferase n=1 Tax=[Pantoea] beijingensis TaxID=1324864 RepID=A0A443IDR3_9GAMM|nr:leucyl/phenylalanyl-tRNA--protein transferase [[Pantoea] beijingensis]RWR02040.1 leucyl/phenylalanyl-tRNA--protein transferase [[Pantoea] beijingensis]